MSSTAAHVDELPHDITVNHSVERSGQFCSASGVDLESIPGCVDKSKEQDKQDLANFLQKPANTSKVQALLKSKFASYNPPRTDYEKVMNIISVSAQRKIEYCGDGSKGCQVLNTWRNWSKGHVLSLNVPKELGKAPS